jgi:putative ABC transport system substrate-binding protein
LKNILSIIILLFLTILNYTAAAYGQEVVVVQSARFTPYEEALRGFHTICRADITRIVISELERNDVTDRINRIVPDIILAIGMDALIKVKSIREIPIIYLMVLYPQSILAGEENITGVSMNITQERQLIRLSTAMPGIKNVGLVYDPAMTGHIVEGVREAAGLVGVNLIAKAINHAGEGPMAIRSMGDEIDVLWMLPDRTVITDETIETMFLFSIENMTPVLTFSEKYLELGALMSIGVDPFDMGRQAGESAESLLSGNVYEVAGEKDARKEVITVNMNTAEKMGITLSEEILALAGIIE